MLADVEPEEFRVRAEDVARLNEEQLGRSAALARTAGTLLLWVGVAGALAWVWLMLRQQGLFDDADARSVFEAGDDPDLRRRLDLFTGTLSLLVAAALTAGAGIGLRLAGEVMIARAGGSLTSARVGDELPVAGDEDEPW